MHVVNLSSKHFASSAAHNEDRGRKKQMSGAAKKRFNYLMEYGYDYFEAKALAQKPINACNTSSYKRNMGGMRGRLKSSIAGTSIKPGTLISSSNWKTAPAPVPKPPSSAMSPTNSWTQENQLPNKQSNISNNCVSSIVLAILPSGYPITLWTHAQLRTVQHGILAYIRQQDESAVKPCFASCVFQSGWLSVGCRNAETAEWLKATAPKLTLWQGAELEVMPESELRRSVVLVGDFPELDNTSADGALQLIQGQNADLLVGNWRILRRAQRGTMVQLAISIDPISALILKQRDFKLNYGFGCVKMVPEIEWKVPLSG